MRKNQPGLGLVYDASWCIEILACLVILWLAMVGYAAHEKIAPLSVKKKVTITVNGLGSVGFIFSNAQPHNEIIYEMKSDWIPRLEAAPKNYVDKVITTPYDTYLASRITKLTWKYVSSAIVPVVVLLAIGCLFLKIRKN